MSDRKKLTPAQRTVLEVLAPLPVDRPALLGNVTASNVTGATVHTGAAENLHNRGYVLITYRPTAPGGWVRITDEGRKKLHA